MVLIRDDRYSLLSESAGSGAESRTVVPAENYCEMHPRRVLRPVWWLRPSGWNEVSRRQYRQALLTLSSTSAGSHDGMPR